MNKDIFSNLVFQFPFRKYQKLILHQVEAATDTERKYHIIAPPGSGKTIVGLELIKRFAEPSVVFTPTSTIQLQWRERVRMFIPEGEKIKLDDIISISPDSLKLINVFTYQLLSSPAENLQFVEEAALFEWKDELVSGNVVATLEEAEERIALLKRHNPTTYKKELSKYYKKIKGLYLRDPQFDGSQFLHENARKLIDNLVESGVKIIVMDEVHHLLDYWALVLKELIKRIEEPILIGLTATPPLSANDEELENYLTIIGDIDFEIPTPAVVKEGDLAPYQDLVYFCNPSKKEKDFIDSIQMRFKALIEDLGQRETLKDWVRQRILERTLADGKKQEWATFYKFHVFLAVAGVKYIRQILNEDLPRDIVELEEMEHDLTIEDWVHLLTDYSLNFLKISANKEHHTELQEIRNVLRSFGYVLTEKGIRQHRAPSDIILALSESKDQAMVKILRTEIDSMGEKLRAVVITDFEKQSATVAKHLEGILDREAGGAVRAFRYIVHDAHTTKLEPILVTGTTVLMDMDKMDEILENMEQWRARSGLTFEFETKATEYEKIVEITGSGKDWKSNTYVNMVTDLFDSGVIKCIVGTRGLLGEGWDSLSLNTLIDLTSATTSMTVNQVRGRSIRLDPNWQEKVANNWDIICVEPSFEKGDRDFERFMQKHKRFYGLGSNGKIIKGYLHVDESLALQHQTEGFKKIGYSVINSRMLAKSRDRAKVYKEWQIGQEYSNFEYSATKLDAKDIKFKTVFTLKDSLKAIFRNILIAIGTFTFWYFYILGGVLEGGFQYRPLLAILSIIFVFGVLFSASKNIKKYVTKAFIEVPLDSFLLDIGKSLLKSLREAQLISSSHSVDNVRVVQDSTGHYDLYLDYATKEDSQIFSKSLRELLAPVTDQRYLVSRSVDNIDMGFYSLIWWTFRKIFRILRQEKIAYHPIPDILSINKKRASLFAQNWKQYVGGGNLIYTRTAEGAELLLRLRKYNRHHVKRMNFDVWK